MKTMKPLAAPAPAAASPAQDRPHSAPAGGPSAAASALSWGTWLKSFFVQLPQACSPEEEPVCADCSKAPGVAWRSISEADRRDWKRKEDNVLRCRPCHKVRKAKAAALKQERARALSAAAARARRLSSEEVHPSALKSGPTKRTGGSLSGGEAPSTPRPADAPEARPGRVDSWRPALRTIRSGIELSSLEDEVAPAEEAEAEAEESEDGLATPSPRRSLDGPAKAREGSRFRAPPRAPRGSQQQQSPKPAGPDRFTN